MLAVVYERYGPPDVLELREVPKPVPRDHEILIKIRATTVTSGDTRARSLDVPAGFGLISRVMLGVYRPRRRVLGSELAGDVEAVGTRVSAFKVGDPVVAFSDAGLGCHAQYRCMPADGAVTLKPANLTYAQAAALPFGGTTALYFLRKGNVRRGDRVLVNGASGTVGTAGVQLARYFGADVTGVCSTANVDLVRSLGATRVIDYTQEDFAQSGQTYDIIVDTVGTAPFPRSRTSLGEGGRLLLIFATLPDMLRAPWVSMTSQRTVIAGVAVGKPEDLRFLVRLAEAGTFTSVIDRSYPLEQIVEAHRYVDTRRKRGSVVITVSHDE